MDTSELGTYVTFAKQTVTKAADIFKNYYAGDAETEYKENNTPVTIADKAINSLVIEAIKEKYPTHDVLGEEESSLDNSSDWLWICDPIDGTSPFTWHLPYACIVLALTYKGEAVVSVIYDVGSDRLYTATKGGGAYCNDKKISVNSISDAGKLVVDCSGTTGKYIEVGEVRKNIGLACHRLLVLMCVAQGTVLVANGSLGGEVFVGQTAHDMAAASLIVAEAGGTATDLFGNKLDFSKEVKGMVCSNGLIHDQLLETVQRSLKQVV